MKLTAALGVLLGLFLIRAQAGRPRTPRSQLDDEDEDVDVNVGEDEEDRKVIEELPMSVTDYLRSPTQTEVSLRDRNLLNPELDAATILLEHHFYSSEETRAFSKEVLGYVTPWNSRGYEVALLMKNKLDIVVPVWFRLVRINGEVEIDGVKDMNKEWLRTIQRPDCSVEDHNAQVCVRRKIIIAPRLKVETELHKEEDIVTAARLCKYLLDKYDFDGFTVEMNLNLAEQLVKFTLVLKENYKMFVVLVAPPIEVPQGETGAKMRNALEAMTRYVDRVSVMSYDANQAQEGPNAPIAWVKTVVSSMGRGNMALRKKLLMGVPFYGWRGSEDMTGEKMVVWLASAAQRDSNAVRVGWDTESAEHVFTEVAAPSGRVLRRCYYPTPLFLQRRLRLAEQQSIAGVAIWELGQGWAAFMDVF